MGSFSQPFNPQHCLWHFLFPWTVLTIFFTHNFGDLAILFSNVCPDNGHTVGKQQVGKQHECALPLGITTSLMWEEGSPLSDIWRLQIPAAIYVDTFMELVRWNEMEKHGRGKGKRPLSAFTTPWTKPEDSLGTLHLVPTSGFWVQ